MPQSAPAGSYNLSRLWYTIMRYVAPRLDCGMAIVMLALLDKHSFIAIFIAVLLEELGIPMPIPTDLLIVFAGVRVAGSTYAFAIWFLLLNIASAAGASGLYLIVRRGGRPLIDRYGR